MVRRFSTAFTVPEQDEMTLAETKPSALGRFADVLGQGEDHLPLGVEYAQRCFLAQLLAFLRMHTAAKRVPHIRSLLCSK